MFRTAATQVALALKTAIADARRAPSPVSTDPLEVTLAQTVAALQDKALEIAQAQADGVAYVLRIHTPPQGGQTKIAEVIGDLHLTTACPVEACKLRDTLAPLVQQAGLRATLLQREETYNRVIAAQVW